MTSTTTDELRSLLRAGDNCKTKCASEAGAFGERVQYAVENFEIRKDVINHLLKQYRMAQEVREAFWSQLQFCVDICEEAGIFGSHEGDLVEQAEGVAEDESFAENLTRLNAGISQLEEEPPVAAE